MITNALKKFLANLINIDIKEETNNIKLRSILKIYDYVGICAHIIIAIVLLIDKNYIAAIVAFVYWLLLLVFAKVGDVIALEITDSTLVLSTAIYASIMGYGIGGIAGFQLLFFLLIPIISGDIEKNPVKRTIIVILTCILYIYSSYRFVYIETFWEVSNYVLVVCSIVNATLVFLSLVLHTLLCDIYSNTTIDKLKEDKKMLDKDSKMDHLTGLYNRRSMERYLETLEDQYHITNKPFGLILFDIDFFKKVNDTYGHQAGDKVLAEISRLIVYSLRKSDEVFRYGGEEMLAVVTGVQTKDDLLKVANGIREDISLLKIPCDDIDVSVTISAGVTLFDGSDIESIIKRVDEALYAAKNNGRNRVEYI